MTLLDWIEKNPWLALIGTSAAFGSACVGVASFLFTEKLDLVEQNSNLRIETLTYRYEHKIENLERRINSISRGISSKEQFDIRNLFVDESILNDGIEKQESFDNQRFYAANNLDIWNYELTNELALVGQMMTQKVFAQFKLAAGAIMDEMAKDFPLHLWKFKKPYRIEDNSIFSSVFAHAWVQRADGEVLGKYLSRTANNDKNLEAIAELVAQMDAVRDPDLDKILQADAVTRVTSGNLKDESSEDVEQRELLIQKLVKVWRGDLVASFLATFMNNLLGLNLISDDVTASLTNMQKVRNVGYMSFLVTLIKPKVDGKLVERFFIRREIIVASVGSEIFVISVITPLFDLRTSSDEAVAVAEWLDDLRIVTQL